jgi:hypothetical protein
MIGFISGRTPEPKFPNGCYHCLSGRFAKAAQIGGHMDAARQYHQLALDCLNLAGATHDPATQDQMMRLAEFCARLADDAEDKASSPQTTINPPDRVRILR